MRSTVQTVDYVVLVGYLCLMAGVGAYFMRYMRGGNYLDTMPDPAQAARSLSRVRLRVHQDILINTSALVEPVVKCATALSWSPTMCCM